MTKPNQIDPYGRAHLHPGRRTATLTGNRDHKDAWIICTMDRAWRKEGRQYLRLFFLDGATALAAGFRPCNRCQGALRKQFSAQWGAINGGSPKVADIDTRLSGERGRLHDAIPSTLPTGAMIDVDGKPWLVVGARMHPWSFDGYGAPMSLAASARLITPPSTVAVIAAGFAPVLHSSVAG